MYVSLAAFCPYNLYFVLHYFPLNLSGMICTSLAALFHVILLHYKPLLCLSTTFVKSVQRSDSCDSSSIPDVYERKILIDINQIWTSLRQAKKWTSQSFHWLFLSFQLRLWTLARLTSSGVTMAGASQVLGSVMVTMTAETWVTRTNGINVVSEVRLILIPRKLRVDGWSIQLFNRMHIITCFTMMRNYLMLIFTHIWLMEILS